MAKNRRLELIAEIQEKRKSHVIAYVLSDRPGAEGSIGPDGVEEMYRLLSEMKPLERKSLDLFLFSHRGDTTVPWRMVGMIREMLELINVIVPHKAHGAATMIALGADNIIMSERGELSFPEVAPMSSIAAGIGGGAAREASVEEAKAVMSLMESFGRVREKQRVDAFIRLMDRAGPMVLGSAQRLIEQIRTDCLKLLERRRKRLSRRRNRQIVDRLFSDFGQPHRTITRSLAVKGVGLKQVRNEEPLEPAFLELLTLYEKEFLKREPLDPESALEGSAQDRRVFPDRKLAYMESANRTRVLLEDLKVQKVRSAPPNINLDPRITLPSLQIGADLKDDDVWSFIERWLQGRLPGLIDEALTRFRQSLPESGYRLSPMNRRWVDE